MIIFAIVLTIGILGLIFYALGLLPQFLILFFLALTSQFIINKYFYNNQLNLFNNEDFPEDYEGMPAPIDAEADILNRKQVPVRIDSQTGAYVVDMDDIIKLLDDYYSKLPIIKK